MVPPSGVKLGSSPPSEVIWVKPPPVIGMMAMPVPLTKTMVWPLAETSGRSSAMLPHAANGQSTLATPVLGSRVWRSLVTLLTQTIGPLVPGNAACADGAAATKAKPAMVPVARSVPKRPRHLLLSADTRSPSFWVGPIWFPRRDPGPTTRSRRRNANAKREPRRAPSSVSWSRSVLLLLAEEVLDVDRAVGDRDRDRGRARLRAEVTDPGLGGRAGSRLGHRAARHRDRVGAGAVGGRR